MRLGCLRWVCGLVLMSAQLMPEEDATLLKGLLIPDVPWFVCHNLPLLSPSGCALVMGLFLL